MSRRFFRKAAVVVAVLGIVLLADSVYAVGDEVRVALMYEPTTINTLEMKTGIDIPVILHMHESLITSDPETGDRTIKNSLSEFMEILPDNKTIRIRLRKNAIFHTGDPVTAHDVKFTYEQVVNPRNANMMSGPIDEIEEIEVIDDHNLLIRFYEPYAAWQELLWVGIASKKYYEKVGPKRFRKHPVGSGAYKFVSRSPGEYILMERFEQHPVFRPDFKKLKFMIVSDAVTRLAMLETGELDLVSNILPHHLKRLKRNKTVIIKKEPTFPSLYGISVKPDNYPVFKEQNVNRALSHAINRREIINRVFLGEGYPLYMYASRSELGYDPDVVYEFNPEKARKLLRDSSYRPGDPVILTYTSLVPNSRMIAAMVQRYLTKVGFTIKLQQLEAGVQATYSRNRDPREGHMTLYSWGGGRDPSTRLFMSIVSTSDYSSWSTRPHKKEIDQLVKEQAREMDKGKRLKLLKKLHHYLRTPSAGVILFGSNLIYAHTDRIAYQWAKKDAFWFNLHLIKKVK